MNRKNYKIPPVDTLLPLDKTYKRGYNERDTFLEGFNSVGTVKRTKKELMCFIKRIWA